MEWPSTHYRYDDILGTDSGAALDSSPKEPAARQTSHSSADLQCGQDIVESIFPRWRMQLISELAFLSSIKAWELTLPMLKGERVHRRYLGGHVSLKVAP